MFEPSALTYGSLFSGIGGIDLGLDRAGWECRWQCEIDSFCREVLAKHWPDVKRYGDVKKVKGEELEVVAQFEYRAKKSVHTVARRFRRIYDASHLGVGKAYSWAIFTPKMMPPLPTSMRP